MTDSLMQMPPGPSSPSATSSESSHVCLPESEARVPCSPFFTSTYIRNIQSVKSAMNPKQAGPFHAVRKYAYLVMWSHPDSLLIIKGSKFHLRACFCGKERNQTYPSAPAAFEGGGGSQVRRAWARTSKTSRPSLFCISSWGK